MEDVKFSTHTLNVRRINSKNDYFSLLSMSFLNLYLKKSPFNIKYNISDRTSEVWVTFPRFYWLIPTIKCYQVLETENDGKKTFKRDKYLTYIIYISFPKPHQTFKSWSASQVFWLSRSFSSYFYFYASREKERKYPWTSIQKFKKKLNSLTKPMCTYYTQIFYGFPKV